MCLYVKTFMFYAQKNIYYIILSLAVNMYLMSCHTLCSHTFFTHFVPVANTVNSLHIFFTLCDKHCPIWAGIEIKNVAFVLHKNFSIVSQWVNKTVSPSNELKLTSAFFPFQLNLWSGPWKLILWADEGDQKDHLFHLQVIHLQLHLEDKWGNGCTQKNI